MTRSQHVSADQPRSIGRRERDPSLLLLKQLEQALAEARAEADKARDDKQRFLLSINHEFRTPMNGVLAAAELLKRQSLCADAAGLVEVIAESAAGLQRLLEDAIDIARDTGAPLAMDPRPVRVAELVDEADARWTPMAAENGVRFACGFDGDAEIAATLDPLRLTQVMDAFAEQAVARQRGGGVVELRLRARRDDGAVTLRVTVRDNGATVPPPALARLFEPFVLDDGRGFEGRGLRLALARRVAEAMHGQVWAEAADGGGLLTGFDVRLAEARTLAEPAGDGLADPNRSPRVLIVDDNATNRMVAAAFCEGAGCLCETADDGAQAVEAVRSRPFDVVLMDIKMPVLDGVAATRAIRGLPDGARAVPIIALTANVDPELAREYLAAGMCAVVDKPIKPEKLFAALNAAVSNTPSAQAVAA